jgi:hypothetical protein
MKVISHHQEFIEKNSDQNEFSRMLIQYVHAQVLKAVIRKGQK